MHGVPGWDIFLMRGANAPRAPASLTPSLRSQASRVPWPGTSPHRPPCRGIRSWAPWHPPEEVLCRLGSLA